MIIKSFKSNLNIAKFRRRYRLQKRVKILEKWAKFAISPDDLLFFFLINVLRENIYHIEETKLRAFFVKKNSLISSLWTTIEFAWIR